MHIVLFQVLPLCLLNFCSALYNCIYAFWEGEELRDLLKLINLVSDLLTEAKTKKLKFLSNFFDEFDAMREVFFLTLSVLLTWSVLGENISEDTQSEQNSTESPEDIIHVNTNDFLTESAVINETLVASRPELSVSIDYENPEMKNIRESSREAAINGEKYISLDSYSFHIAGFHPQEKISSNNLVKIQYNCNNSLVTVICTSFWQNCRLNKITEEYKVGERKNV